MEYISPTPTKMAHRLDGKGVNPGRLSVRGETWLKVKRAESFAGCYPWPLPVTLTQLPGEPRCEQLVFSTSSCRFGILFKCMGSRNHGLIPQNPEPNKPPFLYTVSSWVYLSRWQGCKQYSPQSHHCFSFSLWQKPMPCP